MRRGCIMSNNRESSVVGNEVQVVLGEYLFDCLKNEGITEIFGVPGDFNFSLLDHLEKYEGINFVNGRNELNSGYAADGYARVKGIAALITTFGVGELSACNAIAGSNSEHVPVIHIVGAPPSIDQQEHKLMHHTLMDGNFDTFRKVYEPITAYTAKVTPENAMLEIPTAIHIAKEKKKPVYLVIADDLVMKPIVMRKPMLPKSPVTNPKTLQAALAHAKQLLESSEQSVFLVDVKMMRFHLQQDALALAEAMNLPVASMMFGKGGFDESHPNFIGMYAGQFGSDAVRSFVESAQCVISIGLVWADSNTAKFSAMLDPLKLVDIQPDKVKIGQAEYRNVLAQDMIKALKSLGFKQEEPIPKFPLPYTEEKQNPEGLLSAQSYYPRIQQMLKVNDIVIGETGSFFYGLSQIRLPRGVTYITQGGWQSIGYATPSTFGACIAAPERRVLLFTGDGSLQLTAQEISSMLANDCKPIIFVLNNCGYTIEKYLNVKTENQLYNQIPNWEYTKLPEAFGESAFTAVVKTNKELDDAIKQAEGANKLCIIEMIINNPLDAPEYMVKMREYLKR